jgi:hypothetical protein
VRHATDIGAWARSEDAPSDHSNRRAPAMNSQTDMRERAERHAKEAEQLLARRFGFLDNTLKAQAHATLAVYYSGEARS